MVIFIAYRGWFIGKSWWEFKKENVRCCLYKKRKAGSYPAFQYWCGGMESNHHGVAPASPSSWCVYQFRHHRISVAPNGAKNIQQHYLLNKRTYSITQPFYAI